MYCSTTGYICSEVVRLDSTVMELRLGRMSLTKEYACDKEYFNERTETFTLVGGPHSACPLSGVYGVSIRHSDFSLAVRPDRETGERSQAHLSSQACSLPYTIQVGCRQHDRRDLTWAACHDGMRELISHQCVTHWEREGRNYFITVTGAPSHYSCYSYTVHNQITIVKMLGTQCRDGHVNSFPFNITREGDCDLVNLAVPRPVPFLLPLLLLLDSLSLLRQGTFS